MESFLGLRTCSRIRAVARDAAPCGAVRVSFAAARGRIQGPLRRPDPRVFERYADWCEHRRRCVPTPPRRVHLSSASEGKRDPNCRLARLTCNVPSDLEESHPPACQQQDHLLEHAPRRAASGVAPRQVPLLWGGWVRLVRSVASPDAARLFAAFSCRLLVVLCFRAARATRKRAPHESTPNIFLGVRRGPACL